MSSCVTRRDALRSLALLLGQSLSHSPLVAESERKHFRLATFSADVTPPIGHPLLGNLYQPAKSVADPLQAIGFVLTGSELPLVLVAIDWCEIRNDAYDRWREVLAEAAGTKRERVLVTSVHQHDAPLADLEAQRILDANNTRVKIIDFDFHEEMVQRVARALRESLASAQPVTHLGLGTARVEQVASNRRVDLPDGTFHYGRMSASAARYGDAPVGLIDPLLRTISFWNHDQPIAALSAYATHPMSYYGGGEITSDFVGLARERRQADDPQVRQIYVSGCSGNITAGKYNDGARDKRPLLRDRLYRAMAEAWKNTRRQPLDEVGFRVVPLRLEPRVDSGYAVEDLQKLLTDPAQPAFRRAFAAKGLSWHKRADPGYRLDLPVIQLGPARIILLPGESYVEFQLLAQQLLPDAFVMAIGYGECAPGYIPTDKHFEEKDLNLNDWCWVAPGAEKAMAAAIKEALVPSR